MSSQESTSQPLQTSEVDDPLRSILNESKSKFKSCSQIGFYRRQKRLFPGKSPYCAQLDTLTVDEGSATLQIFNQDTKVSLQLQIIAFKDGIFRLKINEISPLKPRYEVSDVLVGEPATERISVSKKESGNALLEYPNGPYKLHIMSQPFSLSVTLEDKALLSVNSQGLLYFENLLPPMPNSADTETGIGVLNEYSQQDEDGLWREKFGEFVDIKASGPTSVGLDVSLHGFEYVYGLPEHADTHRLQNTGDGDAYRLYNLDVFGYRISDKMGTYGSVPLLLAHKPLHTCGVFWLNASETLVEINSRAVMQPDFSKAAPDIRKQRAVPQTDVRWMSESGIVDFFLLMGPAPQDVFRQYAHLTGTQAFPPLFSLGYHQCRWNYEDETDVEAVDSGFDEYSIPYDVIWLDIEHTDGKRYFTWDKDRFPNPTRMQEKLKEKRRKLVVISDPHIKVDPDYTIYTQAKDRGYFVKEKGGQDFEGTCWPGTSSYLDFTNPAVRDWYAAQYAFDTYKVLIKSCLETEMDISYYWMNDLHLCTFFSKPFECQGSTEDLFIWNDMNEPSVFEAPEMTMPKSAVHHQGWEHRDLHNLYGFYQVWSAYQKGIQRMHLPNSQIYIYHNEKQFVGDLSRGKGDVTPPSDNLHLRYNPNGPYEFYPLPLLKRSCLQSVLDVMSMEEDVTVANWTTGYNHRPVDKQMSTTEGLTRRSSGQERPFVLTRSFFAGSQRYGAVWTGDNKAEWEYLKISIPMLLTLSVTGITFCGADVGGFVGDPESELLLRWYQAGSFQPFFRAHAIQDSKRREPWLFGADNTRLIKRAIEERYNLLPYWYLLFYQAHVSAEIVMRPLWVEFPKNLEVFGVENQYMLVSALEVKWTLRGRRAGVQHKTVVTLDGDKYQQGNALLVIPVLEPGISTVDVLFPGSRERWYDFRKYECVRGPHKQKVGVTLEEIPVYQRGGSIIPMYTRNGKSTGWMDESPYELRVALDSKGSAAGELFLDDGHSFKYLHENMFSYRRFVFQKNVLSSSSADTAGHYLSKSVLEKVLFMGVKRRPSEVTVHTAEGGKTRVAFTYTPKLCVLTLDSLSLSICADWKIHITSS